MGADHPLYGQLAAMGRLADTIGELGEVPSRASRAIADDLSELLAEQYAEGVDAYGKPWRPLQTRTLLKHGAPPLQAEFGGQPGPMAEGTIVRPLAGKGVALEAPFPAGIHMTGAGNPDEADPHSSWGMHARPMFPVGDMPDAWRKVIDERVREAFGRGGRR